METNIIPEETLLLERTSKVEFYQVEKLMQP